MRNVLFQTGQRIIKQILDWLQLAKESSDVDRRNDYTEPGLLHNELNEFDVIVGANNTPLAPSVTIRTGIAYDVNGERVLIDDEDLEHDATNPSDTTDDGFGNLISTPHSTGSKNVPLTVNVNNFVWVDYLQVTDESVFTLQKITNSKQFYKKVDGYEILVTVVDTPPTANSLKLGNIDLTGSGVVSGSTISLLDRLFSLTKLERVKIHTVDAGKTNATQVYGFDEDHTLDEHVKAVGSGTPTPKNPHAISAVDIGLPPAGTVEEHQEFFHTSGVIANPNATTSGLFPAINFVNPGTDQLIFKALLVSERVNIDGVIALQTDFLIDHIENFNALDSNGTWYLYVDKVTRTIQRTQTDLIATPDAGKFLLCTVDWTFPGATGGDLTNLVDIRVFGVTGFKDVQAELPNFVIALLSGNYPTVSNVTYSAINFNALTSDFSGTDPQGTPFSYSAAFTYTPNNDDINAVLVSSVETFTYGLLSVTTNTTYAYDGNDNLITVTRI